MTRRDANKQPRRRQHASMTADEPVRRAAQDLGIERNGRSFDEFADLAVAAASHGSQAHYCGSQVAHRRLRTPSYALIMSVVAPSTARTDLLELVAAEIQAIAAVRLVAVDGVDGAGKTVFAHELADTLARRGSTVIRASVDSFHNTREIRYRKGRDSPEGFFRDSFNYTGLTGLLLGPLGRGGDGRFRRAIYDIDAELRLTRPVWCAVASAIGQLPLRDAGSPPCSQGGHDSRSIGVSQPARRMAMSPTFRARSPFGAESATPALRWPWMGGAVGHRAEGAVQRHTTMRSSWRRLSQLEELAPLAPAAQVVGAGLVHELAGRYDGRSGRLRAHGEGGHVPFA